MTLIRPLIFIQASNSGAATNRMGIDKDGDVTVSTGNLVIGTAGRRIDFSAQTASSVTGASASSELLDHYERGTWTPDLLRTSTLILEEQSQVMVDIM